MEAGGKKRKGRRRKRWIDPFSWMAIARSSSIHSPPRMMVFCPAKRKKMIVRLAFFALGLWDI